MSIVCLPILALLITACSVVRKGEKAIEIASAYIESRTGSSSLLMELPFKHIIVDNQPNSGIECCSDVAALGDINGDGFLDAIIGAENSPENGLVWYSYPDWTKYAIGDGDYTTDGETADIDRDGDIDVVISSISEDEIVWWENTGQPTQKFAWFPHSIASGFVHDIDVGDFNGDGTFDVISKSKGRNERLALHLAPPNPQNAWETILVDEISGEGLASGDIDSDGDLDLAMSHYWYENQSGDGLDWQQHTVTDAWGPDTRVVVQDMNRDDKLDIVLSHAEGKGRISWFENPNWNEHTIDFTEVEGVHSLEVGDFNLDLKPDVFAGMMHTSGKKEVMIYLNKGNDNWEKTVLSNAGTHNARIGDFDVDGDIDILGKNYGGSNRVIEVWQNYAKEVQSIKNWHYIALDQKRPDSQKGKMGLVFADINLDGHTDIIAGSCIYINPEGNFEEAWKRLELPGNIDVFFGIDVDDDNLSDLVGIQNDQLVWIEFNATEGRWDSYSINSVPGGRTQGYTEAQIVPGGKPELIFTRVQNLFYLEIPAQNPEAGNWSLVQISTTNEEEGVAAGDFDLDGDIDLAAQDQDGFHTIWLENPGDGNGKWQKHIVNYSEQWLDRIATSDINGDGRLDIIATEETQDRFYNARIYWFEAPEHPKNEGWKKHTIDVWRSINSMDLADIDQDGDIDIVIAEHTDNDLGRWQPTGEPDNVTLWYENQQGGMLWFAHAIEIGSHSSHLGARVYDLDSDGDYDVVSIAWMQYQQLHMWENLTIH